MIGVKVKINALALKAMAGLARDQIPFATALALTSVAGLARDRIKAELPGEFKIRRPWTALGIRSEMARKRDWPRSKSLVGSVDPYMVDFEEGGPHAIEGTRSTGMKTGRGTTAFVIPVGIRKFAGLSIGQVVPHRLWPARVRKDAVRRGRKGRRLKPKAFWATIGGKTGVFVRNGEHRNSGVKGRKGREGLTLLWAIETRPSRAPRKHWLVKSATAVLTRSMASEFDKAMKKAMASRR